MKHNKPLVVLDLETTGTWVEKDKIIEIGMIKLMPDGSQSAYEKRVNPEMPIPKEVTELTGISDADVKGEKPFRAIAREILEFIGDADLGGFNIERFDLPLLAREFSDIGAIFSWDERIIYDAQKIYHIFEKRDLSAAYTFYCSKELTDAHTASADAQAALEILFAQSKKYTDSPDNIEKLKHIDYEKRNEFFDKERKFRWWNGKLYPMFGKYGRKLHMQEITKIDRPYLAWILTQSFEETVKEMIREVLIGKYPKQEINKSKE